MKKVIFCEIAWMKNYCGITEEDKPVNGGKYIKNNQTGGEIFNFWPYNHNCYGYVMHYGEELHLEHYDQSPHLAELQDVTVVWVATDNESRKIVGWYEHATMYRFWQEIYDNEYAGNDPINFNFKAKETDCYLIPEEKRSFEVPSASKAGKGKGMGQSQVWYADSSYAQEIFIPKVLEYLDQARKNTICNYPDQNAMIAKATDMGASPKELCDQAFKTYESGKIEKSIALMNLAVFKDDSYDTRMDRCDLFFNLGYYNEAEQDCQKALIYKQDDIACLSTYMYIEIMLHHEFIAIEIGEKLRKMREQDPDWKINACNLTYAYLNTNNPDKAIALLRECEREKDNFGHEFIDEAWDTVKKIQEDRY